MEVFAARGLTFTYPGQDAPALRNVSFTLNAGDFVTLAGPSGGGKSTLLRQLKPALTPHGTRGGALFFEGTPLERTDERTQAARIGFVQQNPDAQLVTDKVWHELAFGLESLGCDSAVIRSRTAEMASFFGIGGWYYKNVSELSGGQKQLLNLAAVMAMQPSALILDEPTSQLDPIAAAEFLSAVGRINRELGVTVLLSEHRLEEALPLSGRLMVLDGGALVCDDEPRLAGQTLRRLGHGLFAAMPVPMRVWAAVENDLPCPVTVREGRDWLERYAAQRPLLPVSEKKPAPPHAGEPAAELREVWFRYDRQGPDVLRGLTLRAWPGELLCVLGGNGAGKTTALSLLSGLIKPWRGTARVTGRATALSQEPQSLFVKKTVREDLFEMLSGQGLDQDEKERRVWQTACLCRVEGLMERHPGDLSGGEQQRAALAKVLLTQPELLLLDEPTKGLDAAFKESFAAILRALTERGVCVVMVSHDVEFCACHADRCALFFDGAVAAENGPREFFAGNSFYTTAANRMARQLLPEAVTARDVVEACGGDWPQPPAPDGGGLPGLQKGPVSDRKNSRPPLWRRLTVWGCALVSLAAFAYTLTAVDLTEILKTGASSSAGTLWPACLVLLLSLAGLAAAAGRRERTPGAKLQKGRLPKRTAAAMALSLLAVPLTVWAGLRFFGDRRYYLTSVLIVAETMLPFFLAFEGRKPRARELVLLASLCALGTAARAAFIALPGFKPVMAVVITAGVAFGAQAGFLVGAVTIFASNMLFGQGPWTPWQMLAMGLVGFLAGALSRTGFLRRDRLSLSVFGVFMAVLVYGGLMNPVSVLMVQPDPTWQMFLTAYATGLPVDLVHGAATVLFLWLLGEPLLEKLERVKRKYGLLGAQG